MTRHEFEGPMDGVTFVVDESGRPDGPVLVWLHGTWGQVDDLPIGGAADDARVLSLHLPGWGESDGVESFKTLPDLALGCWWALDQLDAHDVTLVGHGIGALLGIELAAQQPDRVRAVVAAAPFGMVDERDPGADFFALLPPDLMPHLYADPQGDLPARHFPPPVDAHDKGLSAIRRVVVLGAASRFLFPLPDTGVKRRLYRLAGTPVDLVFGAQDGLIPAATRDLWSAAMPDAEITVVEDAAHMLPYESDAVARIVEQRVAAAAAPA